jgi:hypothetical protein
MGVKIPVLAKQLAIVVELFRISATPTSQMQSPATDDVVTSQIKPGASHTSLTRCYRSLQADPSTLSLLSSFGLHFSDPLLNNALWWYCNMETVYENRVTLYERSRKLVQAHAINRLLSYISGRADKNAFIRKWEVIPNPKSEPSQLQYKTLVVQ